MPNSNYVRGRRKEYRCVEILEKRGYLCTRSASSKGLWDVVAVRAVGFTATEIIDAKKSQRLPESEEPQAILVQCKLTKKAKYSDDGNVKKFRKLKVPEGVMKELWVFYDNENLPRGHYEVIKL